MFWYVLVISKISFKDGKSMTHDILQSHHFLGDSHGIAIRNIHGARWSICWMLYRMTPTKRNSLWYVYVCLYCTVIISWYQVVPGTRRGGSFEKETWLIGIHCELERSELKWNEMHEMNELKWINWHEWFEMKELKRMNWIEWIVMNELKRKNWNEGIDMNELKRINRHEGIDGKEWAKWMKWINSHEWIDKNDLKRMNCHEWFETKELKWRNWHEWIETNKSTWRNWREGMS